MQTFLPYKSFTETAKVLDCKRLGKQRVEAFQVLNILLKRTKRKGWQNHPAVKMWFGYENCLKSYYNTILDEWISRGYNNTMKHEIISGEIINPIFLGNEQFHSSHRSNLLRKNYEHYSKFGWVENNNLPYIWPTKTGG